MIGVMPMHDWTGVTAGVYHHFHVHWMLEMERWINGRLSPEHRYAMVEPMFPREDAGDDEHDLSEAVEGEQGVLSVADVPPITSITTQCSEARMLLTRQRQIVVRTVVGDRPVAIIELVSPGNKSGRRDLQRFVDKTVNALANGIHVVLIDPFPPGRLDPDGLHGLIADDLGHEAKGGGDFTLPPDAPLTLAAYDADGEGNATAYIEPTAVGRELIDMPLFFEPGRYINVPLEQTYAAAFDAVPQRWRTVIEG